MIIPLIELGLVYEAVANSSAVVTQGGDYDLVVLSYETIADRQNGYIIYKGGVVATYGPTTMKTDTLIVRDTTEDQPEIEVPDGERKFKLAPKEAYAVGKVEIIDPDGTIQAEDLWFSWNSAKKKDPKAITGRANKFYMKVGTLWMRAESAEMTGGGWILKNVSGSTCDRSIPIYAVSAKELEIIPGQKGKARGLRFQLLGQSLPTIPLLTFSLDRRTPGTRIPQLSYRQREGFGVAWNGNFELNEKTQVIGFINAFPRVEPVYSAYYSVSKVDPKRANNGQFAGQFSPQNDFGERSSFSYTENIYMRQIEDQSTFIQTRRDLFAVGTLLNVGTFGRKSDLKKNYSKTLEVVMERSGPFGKQPFNLVEEDEPKPKDEGGYFYQMRAMSIAEGDNQPIPRLYATGSVLSPLWKQGRALGLLRIDTGLRTGFGTSGWFGGEASVAYEPRPGLRFGVGMYGYQNYGTPNFEGDRFVSDQGFVIRGDLLGSATKLSLMYRYDPTQGWFDKQYRLSQVIGCLEPVLVYREVPNDYQLGIRFRLDSILNLAQQRNVKRSKKTN